MPRTRTRTRTRASDAEFVLSALEGARRRGEPGAIRAAIDDPDVVAVLSAVRGRRQLARLAALRSWLAEAAPGSAATAAGRARDPWEGEARGGPGYWTREALEVHLAIYATPEGRRRLAASRLNRKLHRTLASLFAELDGASSPESVAEAA